MTTQSAVELNCDIVNSRNSSVPTKAEMKPSEGATRAAISLPLTQLEGCWCVKFGRVCSNTQKHFTSTKEKHVKVGCDGVGSAMTMAPEQAEADHRQKLHRDASSSGLHELSHLLMFSQDPDDAQQVPRVDSTNTKVQLAVSTICDSKLSVFVVCRRCIR